MKHILLIALMVDISWYQIAHSPNGIVEITYDDGTVDKVVVAEKDAKSPKALERLQKLIDQRERE